MRGRKKLSLSLNGHHIEPFDPFCRKNSATQMLPEEVVRIDGVAVHMQPYKQPSDFHFRAVRKKPLSMIHVLAPDEANKDDVRVPAFGLSFPPGHYQTEIEVVANQVWIERMHGGAFDTPEEEDDYEE